MTISKTEHQVSASNIREMLPHRYLEELTNRVNKDERNTKYIAKRTVFAVMNEEREDYYYILENAIIWAKEIKAAKNKLTKELENISK